MAEIQVCAFHADEGIMPVGLGDDTGSVRYTCPRMKGHPTEGPYSWIDVPTPPGLEGLSGLAQELNLSIELPAVLAMYAGKWVEYGVVEQAYAQAHPKDFALLVERYGHKAIESKPYTASAFLAKTLGDLSRHGSVLYHDGPATGRWSYNSRISWWTLPPEPEWSTALSWSELGCSITYVPGQAEVQVNNLKVTDADTVHFDGETHVASSDAERVRQAAMKLHSQIERVAGPLDDDGSWLHQVANVADEQFAWDSAEAGIATDMLYAAAERMRYTRATVGLPNHQAQPQSAWAGTYEQLLKTRLPMNRKERFYTGTVLPGLVASDGFRHLHRLLALCDLDVGPLEVGSLDELPPIQLFTEYGFGESVVTPEDQTRFRDRPTGLDTPDVVVLGTDWLLAVEAKMFHRPTTQSLHTQMARQNRLVRYWTETFDLPPDRVRHVLLLPAALKRDRPQLNSPVVTWEAVLEDYARVGPQYWLTVLRTALERYDNLKSPELSFGAQKDGMLSGQDIVAQFNAGLLEFTWMGRQGGLFGAALAKDVHEGTWRAQPYEVAIEEPLHPKNWFSVKAFVERVNGANVEPPEG